MFRDQTTSGSLKRVATLCGAAVVFIGILGFLGWISGSGILGAIRPYYIPMAPSTALAFMLFGTILIIHDYKPWSRKHGFLIIAVVVLVTIFGLLEFVEYFIGVDLTYEELLFPPHGKLGEVPLYQISPIAAAIFFLAGIALLLLLGPRARGFHRQLAGGLGSLVFIAGFICTVGYLFGTPLLYGSSIIPLAATTAIAFILLGSGLMAATGPDGFPVRFLVGPSFQARLLRLVVPLVITAIILHGWSQKIIPGLVNLNYALLTALVALVFAVITALLVALMSRVIARTLDRALAEREQAEAALHQSQKMLLVVLDSIPVSVFWKDRDLHYLGCNKTFLQATGLSDPQAIVGKTDFDLPWVGVAESYRADDRQVMETGTAKINFEETLTLSDGSIRRIQTSKVPLRNQDGTIFGVLGIYEDITARKQAEAALQDSEAKYRKIVETTQEGIWVIDAEARTNYVNRRLAEMLGYSDHEMIGRSLFDFMDDVGREEMQKKLAVRRQGLTETYDFRFQRQDGSSLWAIVAGSPYLDPQGKFTGSMGMITDITDRKQSEAALRESYAKLHRALNGTVLALAAMVEMRDPYTAGHQERVSQLACAIAEDLGFSRDQIEGMRMMSLLHDIGKIGVPAEILNKPGKISDYEFDIIRTHSKVGYEILKDIEFPCAVAEAIAQHHERLDGSGYPQGLSGNQISLPARILAVADVVEAMASYRPYRPALGIDKALEEIIQNKGILYDPEVVDACVKLFTEKKFAFEA